MGDIGLNFISGGVLVTDNIPDNNGTLITDGNMGTTAAFPFIGARNPNPEGVPTGNPPPP